MFHGTSGRLILAVLVLALVGTSGWAVLNLPLVNARISEYRAWCLNMWNSGIFHVFGGAIGVFVFGTLFGGTDLFRGIGGKKGGRLGSSHVAEGMLMGEHYGDPLTKAAARKIRDKFF